MGLLAKDIKVPAYVSAKERTGYQQAFGYLHGGKWPGDTKPGYHRWLKILGETGVGQQVPPREIITPEERAKEIWIGKFTEAEKARLRAGEDVRGERLLPAELERLRAKYGISVTQLAKERYTREYQRLAAEREKKLSEAEIEKLRQKQTFKAEQELKAGEITEQQHALRLGLIQSRYTTERLRAGIVTGIRVKERIPTERVTPYGRPIFRERERRIVIGEKGLLSFADETKAAEAETIQKLSAVTKEVKDIEGEVPKWIVYEKGAPKLSLIRTRYEIRKKVKKVLPPPEKVFAPPIEEHIFWKAAKEQPWAKRLEARKTKEEIEISKILSRELREFSRGYYTELREKPVVTAGKVAIFAAVPFALKAVSPAAVAAMAKIPYGRPISKKVITPALKYGLPAAYTGTVAYRVGVTPEPARAELLGRITAAEITPMVLGYKVGTYALRRGEISLEYKKQIAKLPKRERELFLARRETIRFVKKELQMIKPKEITLKRVKVIPPKAKKPLVEFLKKQDEIMITGSVAQQTQLRKGIQSGDIDIIAMSKTGARVSARETARFLRTIGVKRVSMPKPTTITIKGVKAIEYHPLETFFKPSVEKVLPWYRTYRAAIKKTPSGVRVMSIRAQAERKLIAGMIERKAIKGRKDIMHLTKIMDEIRTKVKIPKTKIVPAVKPKIKLPPAKLPSISKAARKLTYPAYKPFKPFIGYPTYFKLPKVAVYPRKKRKEEPPYIPEEPKKIPPIFPPRPRPPKRAPYPFLIPPKIIIPPYIEEPIPTKKIRKRTYGILGIPPRYWKIKEPKLKAKAREDAAYVAGFVARVLNIKKLVTPKQIRKMASLPSRAIAIRPIPIIK